MAIDVQQFPDEPLHPELADRIVGAVQNGIAGKLDASAATDIGKELGAGALATLSRDQIQFVTANWPQLEGKGSTAQQLAEAVRRAIGKGVAST